MVCMTRPESIQFGRVRTRVMVWKSAKRSLRPTVRATNARLAQPARDLVGQSQQFPFDLVGLGQVDVERAVRTHRLLDVVDAHRPRIVPGRQRREMLGGGRPRPRDARPRSESVRGRRWCAPPARAAARPCAAPTPHSTVTGNGRRKARTPAAGTSSRPSGLQRAEATLATNLVGATPTEQVSPTGWADMSRMATAISTGHPSSPVAPLTSRKASSRDSGSNERRNRSQDGHHLGRRGR